MSIPFPALCQALAAFDELKGVLDALNRRVQLAEADEEKRQEALQQWRAGSHTRLARPPLEPRPHSLLLGMPSVHARSLSCA